MNCDNSLSLVLNVSKFVRGFQHFFVEIEGLSNVTEVIIINSFFWSGVIVRSVLHGGVLHLGVGFPFCIINKFVIIYSFFG